MNEERKDYLRRLIEGVRYAADNDPETIEAKKMYDEDTITPKWIDAYLLCKVIEDEILNVDG